MTKERTQEILQNLIAWFYDHDEEFRECAINAMGLTDEETLELELVDKYVIVDENDEEYEFDYEPSAEDIHELVVDKGLDIEIFACVGEKRIPTNSYHA